MFCHAFVSNAVSCRRRRRRRSSRCLRRQPHRVSTRGGACSHGCRCFVMNTSLHSGFPLHQLLYAQRLTRCLTGTHEIFRIRNMGRAAAMEHPLDRQHLRSPSASASSCAAALLPKRQTLSLLRAPSVHRTTCIARQSDTILRFHADAAIFVVRQILRLWSCIPSV